MLSATPLTAEKNVTILQVAVQEMRVGIEFLYIERVLPLAEVEPLPKSPPYFLGLLDFAERSIPVIDLAWSLDLKNETPYTIDSLILLCHHRQKTIGLVVDSISGLSRFSEEALQEKSQDKTSPFKGNIILDGKIILLLNMHYFFDLSNHK